MTIKSPMPLRARAGPKVITVTLISLRSTFPSTFTDSSATRRLPLSVYIIPPSHQIPSEPHHRPTPIHLIQNPCCAHTYARAHTSEGNFNNNFEWYDWIRSHGETKEKQTRRGEGWKMGKGVNANVCG